MGSWLIGYTAQEVLVGGACLPVCVVCGACLHASASVLQQGLEPGLLGQAGSLAAFEHRAVSAQTEGCMGGVGGVLPACVRVCGESV